jgi:hypothetical protein
MVVGVTVWALKSITNISWLSPPASLADHLPLRYLRTSMRAAPGAEFSPG